MAKKREATIPHICDVIHYLLRFTVILMFGGCVTICADIYYQSHDIRVYCRMDGNFRDTKLESNQIVNIVE